MKIRRPRNVVVAAVAFLFAGVGMAVPPAMPATVKVGAILPMTGPMATFGMESVNGLRLALDQLGSRAPKIELGVEDTQGTPAGSAGAINKLIKTNKVAVVIGEVASSDTIAAAAVAQQNKIPLLSPASTAGFHAS